MKTTLSDFINTQNHPDKKNFLQIMKGISDASKIINESVNKAGLLNILGAAGSENVQGESQQKLDVFADEVFIKSMKNCPSVAGVASEENEDILDFNRKKEDNSEYLVMFDPLDGSSNIDVNISIGTIFSVVKKQSNGDKLNVEDFLQEGKNQVLAGYVLYGTSTMLVYSSGNGVNGFTFDPQTQEFLLSHPDMRYPSDGKIYSINEGNLNSFPQGVQNYVSYCKESDKQSSRPYSARYIGSMVADFHRNLIKGGIFIYPATASSPEGKLRLMYECNPLSFLAEQAGGAGSNGTIAITSIVPDRLHQRVPVYLGSVNMVKKLLEML